MNASRSVGGAAGGMAVGARRARPTMNAGSRDTAVLRGRRRTNSIRRGRAPGSSDVPLARQRFDSASAHTMNDRPADDQVDFADLAPGSRVGPYVIIGMEYVDGDSLAARLKRGRLPIDRVITIGRQLASALAAAHATGIIHRDLKPGNVQVTADGSAKVLDFGVAMAMAQSATTASTTRRPGAMPEVQSGQPGTPG